MCSTPAQSTPSLLKELYHLLYSLKELYLLFALHAQRALPAQCALPAHSTPSLLEELYTCSTCSVACPGIRKRGGPEI